MKAVGLLLCLTLVQGSILRKQKHAELSNFVKTGVVQPLEFTGPQKTHFNYESLQQTNTPYYAINEQQKHRRDSSSSSSSQSNSGQNSSNQSSRQNTSRQNSNQSGSSRSSSSQSSSSQSSSSQSNSQESRETSRHNVRLNVPHTRTGNLWFTPILAADNQDATRRSGNVISFDDVRIASAPYPLMQNEEEVKKIFADAFATIAHNTPAFKKNYHEAYEAIKNSARNSPANASQLIQSNGFNVEKHTVTTDDGYILTVHRVLPAAQQTSQEMQQRPVVFLMHGILGSADDWLLMDRENSLAYLLADAGYDVWLGNARGNKYCRRHVTKHPAQKEFWKFSNDEIAAQDMPKMIDYVLGVTGQQNLFFVGFSQGTTQMFALMSERPEYNKKVKKIFALAPMAYMSHARSPLLRMISPRSQFYESTQNQIGHGEFRPNQKLIQNAGGEMCYNKIGCKHVCSNINYVLSGVNVNESDVNLLPAILNHLPAGGSSRQMKQYGQAIASGRFQKYDYGTEINQKVYGSRQPPSYKVKEVMTPVMMFSSAEDWLAHPADVEKLKKELPNAKHLLMVPEKHFTHMDFMFSSRARDLVYNRLIEAIKQDNY